MTTAATPDLQASICALCKRPAFGATAHPCCVTWNRAKPGKPCVACSASAGQSKPRKQVDKPEVADPAMSYRTERLLRAIELETVDAMIARYRRYEAAR